MTAGGRRFVQRSGSLTLQILKQPARSLHTGALMYGGARGTAQMAGKFGVCIRDPPIRHTLPQ